MEESGKRHAPAVQRPRPRERAPVPMNSRLVGPQSWSGRLGEKSFSFAGYRTTLIRTALKPQTHEN